ncbi:unnamed protein product, partial [Adineta steineri]
MHLSHLQHGFFKKGGVKFDKPSEDDDQSVLLTNMIAQFKKLVGPQ